MRIKLAVAFKSWVYVGLSVAGLVSLPASAADVSASIASALRVHAAAQTAQNNAACTAIKPFYWEIGNQTEALASGSVGGRTYTASTLMPIASSSKWIFGAYVVQARQGQLSQEDISALNMT